MSDPWTENTNTGAAVMERREWLRETYSETSAGMVATFVEHFLLSQQKPLSLEEEEILVQFAGFVEGFLQNRMAPDLGKLDDRYKEGVA